jgi:hypothetical protein
MALTTASLRGPSRSAPSSTGSVSIRITRATVFRRRPVDVGEIILDATSQEAALLIGCGKAVRYIIAAEVGAALRADRTRETASLEPRTETATLGFDPAHDPALDVAGLSAPAEPGPATEKDALGGATSRSPESTKRRRRSS